MGGSCALGPIYFAIQQFFLTARSIYLVVFNAAEGAKATASIKYWVNQIRVSTKGLETPILLVGTHIDHPDVDTDALQNLARQLKRFGPKRRTSVIILAPNSHPLTIGCDTGKIRTSARWSSSVVLRGRACRSSSRR